MKSLSFKKFAFQNERIDLNWWLKSAHFEKRGNDDSGIGNDFDISNDHNTNINDATVASKWITINYDVHDDF